MFSSSIPVSATMHLHSPRLLHLKDHDLSHLRGSLLLSEDNRIILHTDFRLFDDLYMHSDLTKSRRQIIGHPASSANKNFLDLCLKLTFSMHFEKRFHRLMRTGNMKFIPCLKYIFPIRYKYFSLMFYRANKDFDLKLL